MKNTFTIRLIITSLLLLQAMFIFAQNSTQGNWGPILETDVIPVGAANLPDGKILAWSARAKNAFGGDQGQTYTTVFNPSNNSFTDKLVSNTAHDMFCPGTANLPDGRVMITGGSSSSKTTIYNPNNNTYTAGKEMNTPRGYHSMVTLRDGRIFTLGGSWSGGRGNKNAEAWSADAGWVPYPGITADNTVRQGAPDPQGVFRDDNHAWLFAAPNGKVFHAGPSKTMHWIELDGIGESSNAGNRGNDEYAMNGNAVMYDIGKILTLGGAQAYSGNQPASNRSYVIDISGNGSSTVNVRRVDNMNHPRTLQNSVVLPNGEVVTVGGMPRSQLFSDNNAHLETEIWNPNTEQWRQVASMSVPRTYHSVAILMQDGRVWVGGGGLCGNCDVNHPDAQIFTPPYLYASNNSLASRPVITSAPSTANYNNNMVVKTNRRVTAFSLVRLSSVTHSVNNEQRRIPVTFTKSSNTNYKVRVPERSLLPPGNYFLFAMDASGVPSIAKTIRIGSEQVVQEVMDGEYYIQSSATGQNVFSPNWDGVNVRMGSAQTWNSNKWTIKHLGGNVYTIKNKRTNRFLKVSNVSLCQNGANINTANNSSTDNKKWVITRVGSNFFFRPLSCTSRALDKNNGNNGNVLLWDFSVGNNNQKFKLIPTSDNAGEIVNGDFYIRNFTSGQNLMSPSWAGFNVRMYTAGTWNDHKWTIKHIGNGRHTIRNISHGRYLEVSSGDCKKGANVKTWTAANTNYRRWFIDRVGNGYFLRPVHCPNFAIDKSASYTNGNVHIWNYNTANNNQKFELIPVGSDPRASTSSVVFDATPMKGRKSELFWAFDQTREVDQYVIQYATEYDDEFMNLDSLDANAVLDFRSYRFIHETPIVGMNFYQIKIKFVDGTVDYLPFRSLVFEESSAPISIFPNPTEDELYIDLTNYMEEKINYFVIDAKGEIILHGEFEETHAEREMLDLSRYQNGNYFIYLRPEHHREITQQFILMNKR